MSLTPLDDEIVEAEIVGDLDQLAHIANQEHDLVVHAYGSTIEHAFRAGQALTEAKKRVIHGEWLPWLEINFEGARQTATGYMRIYANGTRVFQLEEPSLRQALKAIGSGSSSSANGAGTAARGAKRSPLGKTAEKAGWDFRKATERLQKIAEDDRFSANKEQVAAHLCGHLSYAIEVCQDLLTQLQESTQ